MISPTSTEEGSIYYHEDYFFLHVPFAIRSGGQSLNPNWASIDSNGILISTTNLDTITVSQDNPMASVGPVLRWGAVYEALDPYGISVVGGRIPEYGLAADNVKNFEVDLASGEIVNANAETNSDIFCALEGGGTSFAAFTEWRNNGAQTDPQSSVLIKILKTGCSLDLVYSEPVTYPATFAPFSTIPNGVVTIPPTNATVNILTKILANAFSPASARHVYRSAASLIERTLYRETSSSFLDTIDGLQADGLNVNMKFTLQTIPWLLVAAGEERGGNPMGIQSQTHQCLYSHAPPSPIYNNPSRGNCSKGWTTVTDWASADDYDTVLAAVNSIGDQFETLNAPRKSNIPYVYMNAYGCYANQNLLAQHPLENIKKLKDIAAKYDPGRVFQLLQKDGLLL
ncbi:hypothetical protein DID88_002847 [Monilinia fructigena]|uniref:FAD-binding PCMH-type domain-containing protein n=1 Tax=Monilinia fructigena TaxID=38457 RepID=A0A395IPH9_9HELO|nr:hypothetical protein DID88_002847 [Monilinia fructigena]